MRGLCEAESGTQILMNCCKLEQVGRKKYLKSGQKKVLIRIQVLEDGRVLAQEAKNGKLMDRGELRENNIRGFRISLRWKVSRR